MGSEMNLPANTRSELCDSHREEVASLWTHAIGALLGVVATVLMVVAAEGALATVSAVIFGLSLVLLYSSSSLYHFFTAPSWKALFQRYDHICIYLLIAGSYTPITLVGLGGAWGWTLFGIVWAMAAAGIGVKAFGSGKKDHWISTALYLAMGWLVVIAIVPIIRSLSPTGLAWLVAGGVSYSGGVAFFVWHRLPFNHAIWHLFVLAGSACHVVAVIRYVF